MEEEEDLVKGKKIFNKNPKEVPFFSSFFFSFELLQLFTLLPFEEPPNWKKKDK